MLECLKTSILDARRSACKILFFRLVFIYSEIRIVYLSLERLILGKNDVVVTSGSNFDSFNSFFTNLETNAATEFPTPATIATNEAGKSSTLNLVTADNGKFFFKRLF